MLRVVIARAAPRSAFRPGVVARAPLVGRRFCSSEGGGGGKQQAGNAYSRLLESHPLPTKAVTSALITVSGDAICQLAFSDEPFDFARSGRFFLLGGALVGPVLHLWYGRLFSVLPGAGVADAVKRTAADQLLFAPLFNPLFISCLALLEGTAAGLPTRLRSTVHTRPPADE